MKERKINYGLLVFIAIVIILFIPIISDYVKKQNVTALKYSEVKDKIAAGESFVLYMGDTKDKEANKTLKSIKNSTKKNDYSYEYNVYTSEKNNDLKKLFGNDTIYAIVIEGDIQSTYKKSNLKSFKNDFDIYLLGNINDSNKSYKVAKDYKTYKKLVESKKVTVAVFGRNSCAYCNKFKPVYNAVSNKYNVDIYYFDSDNYNATEYKKITKLDITIPASCNSDNKEFKLSEGFGTPLTIITKKNKVIDCISGYVNRSSLIEKLKNVNLIEK